MFGVESIVKYIGDEKAKARSKAYSIPWSPYEFIHVYDIGIIMCMNAVIEEDETQLYTCRFITGSKHMLIYMYEFELEEVSYNN